MAADHPDPYRSAVDEFVLLWGEMASAWGINRTMAQIHALLYAESKPLDTDSIMEKLEISRGNANMNLRNLLQWTLIHKVHFKGERKDYFTAEKEVWTMVSTLIHERQKREIAPIRERLQELNRTCNEQNFNTPESIEFKERIRDFTEFLEMFERFTDALLPYINKRNLGFLKNLVKLAEAHQTVTGKRTESSEET
jgi:DNA-binding transcriptional regulator GbsR (MarR family)